MGKPRFGYCLIDVCVSLSVPLKVDYIAGRQTCIFFKTTCIESVYNDIIPVCIFFSDIHVPYLTRLTPMLGFFSHLTVWCLDTNLAIGGRDSSVGKSSASQSGDPGSNPGGGLTRITQCMNERGRDCQL